METPKSSLDFTKFNSTEISSEEIKTWDVLIIPEEQRYGMSGQLMKLPSDNWWLMENLEQTCWELNSAGRYLNPRPLYLNPKDFDLKSWMKAPGFLWSPTPEQRTSVHSQLTKIKKTYHKNDDDEEAIFIDDQCIAMNLIIFEWSDESTEKGIFEKYLSQVLDKKYVLAVWDELFYPVPRSALTERIVIDYNNPYAQPKMVKELPAMLKS